MGNFNSNEGEFLKYMQKYYDIGLLKDIMVTDEYRVCNFCNFCYVWFPYQKQLENNSQIGLPLGQKALRELYKDKEFIFKELVSKRANNYTLHAYGDEITKELLDFYEKYKDNPSKHIDFNLEEEILSNQKDMIKKGRLL